jgi:hypothetical protein
MKLVVTQAFGDYAVGAEITDAKAMAEAIAEHPENVVRVADEPDQSEEESQ